MAKRHAPVGQCIYCGATAQLEDEHIIPFALGGLEVLPKSSCRTCAKITGRTEALVLRGGFRGVRERLQFPSRAKDRPMQLPLFSINGGAAKAMVDVADYPACIILPAFVGPKLVPVPGTSKVQHLPWTYQLDFDPRILVTKYGIESWASNSIDGWSTGRMAAKMAYSFAVALGGLGSFRPVILPLILHDDVDPALYIGTYENVDPPEGDGISHQVSCAPQVIEGKTYLIGQVRLFGSLGSPTYCVLLGTE